MSEPKSNSSDPPTLVPPSDKALPDSVHNNHKNSSPKQSEGKSTSQVNEDHRLKSATKPLNSPTESVEKDPISVTKDPLPTIPSLEVRAPAAPSPKKPSVVIEVGKVSKKHRPLVISPEDRHVLCVTLSILSVLTIWSLLIAMSSTVRQQSALAMDRNSYWWYFILTSLKSAYLCLAINVTNSQQPDSLALVVCSFYSAILAIVDLIVVTRFVFVTFPMPDIG